MAATQQESYGQIANYNISPGTRADGQSSALEVDSKGNLKVNSTILPLASSEITGQQKLTASAVQLASNTLTNGVIFTALSTNTGSILIGGSGVTTTADGTGTGYILEPGCSVSFASTNTNLFYVIGTAADVLSFAGS